MIDPDRGPDLATGWLGCLPGEEDPDDFDSTDLERARGSPAYLRDPHPDDGSPYVLASLLVAGAGNLEVVCRHAGASRAAGYAWLRRWRFPVRSRQARLARAVDLLLAG